MCCGSIDSTIIREKGAAKKKHNNGNRNLCKRLTSRRDIHSATRILIKWRIRQFKQYCTCRQDVQI